MCCGTYCMFIWILITSENTKFHLISYRAKGEREGRAKRWSAVVSRVLCLLFWAQKPTENISEAVVGTGCCRVGPITGHMMLTRRGFSIGQNIPFTANIDNRSTRTFNVRIVLSQVSITSTINRRRCSTSVQLPRFVHSPLFALYIKALFCLWTQWQ